MAKTRTKVSKVNRAQLIGFDDQLWPINLALLVLTGFVAGIIIVQGGWDDPRTLHNGWVRLVTLGVTTIGLLVVAMKLDRQIGRRVQLAVLVSLFFHVLGAVFLHEQYLQMLAALEDESREIIDQPPLPTISEYILQPINEPQETQDFQRPVETQAPEVAPDDQVQKEETQVEQTEAMQQPTSLPDPTPEVTPSPIKHQQHQVATPRRADQRSKMSKQTETAAQSAQPAEVAQQQPTPQPQPQPKQVAARATEVQRSETTAQPSTAHAEVRPESTQARPAAQIARRTEVAPLPTETVRTPTMPRKIAQAAQQTPQAAEPRETAAKPAQEAKPTELAPTATVVARSQAAAPRASQEATQDAPAVASPVAQAEAPRQVEAQVRPTLARSNAPAPTRRTASSEISAAAQQQPQAVAVESTPSRTAPGPQSANVARAAAQIPRSTNQALQPSDVPSVTPSNAPTQVASARANPSSVPSLQPSAAPAALPRRATVTAAAAASPVSIDSPALAQSASQNRPTANPASASLSRSQTGLTGRGRSDNADVALPASSHNTAPVASAAARRESASSQETGPQLSASAPARIAKARAGADAPAATAQAQDVAAADIAGSPQPSMAAQAASAAVERSSSSAPASDISAAVGELEIDTGPTQVVPEQGSGRASGGGQPEIALNPINDSQARPRAGGAALAAITADAAAEAPAAPMAEGGGSPVGPSASLAASEQGGRTEGTALPTLAQPLEDAAAGGGSSAGPVVAADLSRAPTEAALPGAAVGGGAEQPRPGKGAEVAMIEPAEALQMEAAPKPGGAEQGRPIDAQGLEAGDLASGLPRSSIAGPVGTIAGDVPVAAPTPGNQGSTTAIAKATDAGPDAPDLEVDTVGGPSAQGKTVALAPGAAEMIDAPEVPEAGGGAAGEASAPVELAAAGEAHERAMGSLPVQVNAEVGAGGLGLVMATEVGLPSRKAQRDSQLIHNVPDKFLNKQAGGDAVVSGTAKSTAAGFERKSRRHGDPLDGGGGARNSGTEQSVEDGLDFLARHQSPDGSWSFNAYGQGQAGYENEAASIQSDAAATGLALLAYLGAGYDHLEDKYQHRVGNALTYLLQHQKENGDLYVPQDDESNKVAQLYTQGIATIALCEAYGMTGDPQLGIAAQKAVDFIVASQHPERGGWRYAPGFMADLSVTGWQLMALKSARLSGLNVPPETLEGIEKFLRKCQGSGEDDAFYVYNPYAADTATLGHGRRPSTTMTSVGVLMRLYNGWNRETPEVIRGADHLLKNLPQVGTSETQARVGTMGNPMRDTYYWYYATQVMFHMKGKYWETWNDTLHPLLLESQIKRGRFAGSWNPRGSVPDRWGPQGGRIYVTTMNILSLEVTYRHLPIYEDTGK